MQSARFGACLSRVQRAKNVIRQSSTGLPRSCLVGLGSHEVAYPRKDPKPRVNSLDKAFDRIKSGDHIFVHGIAVTPTYLLEGLSEYAKAKDLNKITLHHLHLEGPTPWTAPDVKSKFFKQIASFFCF